jgi:hypothetical protein
MRLRKPLLGTLGAIVLLGALGGSAWGRTLSTTSQTLRAAFRTVSFTGAFGNIRCEVTLEGSLHSTTIPKVEEALIGLVTKAELGACSSGAATILRATLPWHMRYDSFAGLLPNISSIEVRIVGANFRVREPLLTCLATTTEEAPAFVTFNRDVPTRALTIVAISGSGIETTCGRVGAFSSTADPVTVLGSAARITVILI